MHECLSEEAKEQSLLPCNNKIMIPSRDIILNPRYPPAGTTGVNFVHD